MAATAGMILGHDHAIQGKGRVVGLDAATRSGEAVLDRHPLDRHHDGSAGSVSFDMEDTARVIAIEKQKGGARAVDCDTAGHQQFSASQGNGAAKAGLESDPVLAGVLIRAQDRLAQRAGAPSSSLVTMNDDGPVCA
ncbi:MAG TPA: hypothetical protein VJ732_01480 [Bryobacteraceae bacterium]|nr:hypothetical protein [Bryobacteraceae bacterium]